MGKHTVFFVHGMGKHDKTWHDAGLNVLKSSYSEYAAFANRSLMNDIEAVPIVYDDKIETWRTRMAEDFSGFRNAFMGELDPAEAKGESLTKQLDQVESWIGASDKPGFAWSHAADVLIYRWMSTLRMAIDVSVATQITGYLAKHGTTKWSIVAHSLGTSVTHNVIHMLYTSGTANQPPLNPVETRPQVLMMVANVSRVLQRPGAKVYETRVKPGRSSTGALCGYYLNARHKYDPFVYPKPFSPDLWPEPGTYAFNGYQHLQPAHLHFDKDELMRVHDLDHYLRNPRVHVPLFRALFGDELIPDEEFMKAKTAFDSSIVSSNLDATRSKLEAMLPASSANWQALLTIIKRIGM
ncbi:hypothetical protein [Pseudoxanthomonas wuyuanensis]|uniref:DDHD domain-containing protein n=1 Tax=Pseudoxanthomonas wuyuanensis TaxID=1073196 RepID=A0A286DBU6_9GAMM|nr:hypothetical protein [Pseudoxanthomonas wuyuanensis]KAF1721699.1 hypothetical protein CSC75_05655 [Pseudoxanthomonas wuyuanensis]SOD56082.1 hypothetical protein SAMN06296416_108166 [Pseudoxanthomonas wuyuanensis]